jgi:hypothetical protein
VLHPKGYAEVGERGLGETLLPMQNVPEGKMNISTY